MAVSEERPPAPPALGSSTDRHLARLVGQAHDAIVSTDLAGRIVTWNDAAGRLFGLPAEAAIGRPLHLLEPRGRAAWRDASLAAAARRVGASATPERVDVSCSRADGGVVDVSASVAPIRDGAARPLGVAIIARDISEQRRDEQALREANRQKDAFLAVMSHELRTPLTSILGYTELLLRGTAGETTPRAHSYLETVRGAGQRLLGLVNGLLEYSRLEAGAEHLNLEPLALEAAVVQAADWARPRAEAKGLTLVVALDERGCVLADADKLQQILSAFLANAVAFTPGGGTIRLETRRDPESDMGCIAVCDTGIGLSADQCERVWERFYQVDGSPLTREHGGIGLGLAIARHLAALHGGRVWAASEGLGRGSQFVVAIPPADRARRERGHESAVSVRGSRGRQSPA